MKRNILITLLVLLVPFFGGGLIGYSLGHRSPGPGGGAGQSTGSDLPFGDACFAGEPETTC